MRNPRFWRNVSLAFSFSGAVAVAGAFLLPADVAGDTARGLLFICGLMSVIFGGGSAFFRQRELRAQSALARGEEVLARWTVDAAAWQEFLAGKHEFDDGPPTVVNEFQPPGSIPREGLEVIVGKEAIQIGESIHLLPRRGTPEVTHAEIFGAATGGIYIELRLYYPGGGQGAAGIPHAPRYAMLRFPVAPGAMRQAETAVAHYRAGRPGKADFFHGRGDGTDAEDLSECISCGYTTHVFASHCPQCGATLVSRRWSRRYGFVLVLCGLFLSIMMGAVLYYTTPLLLHPGEQIGANTFTGTPSQAWMVFGILALVMSFGLTCLAYGAWQMWTGRRSRWVIAVMLGLWTVLMGVAGVL